MFRPDGDEDGHTDLEDQLQDYYYNPSDKDGKYCILFLVKIHFQFYYKKGRFQ